MMIWFPSAKDCQFINSEVAIHFFITDLAQPLASLLAMPEDWLAWPGLDLDPLPDWQTAWGLILGDAAHASLPFLAQGAAMAVEDAATLARHLGAPVRGYEQIEHPAQRMVESTLKQMAGLTGALPYGVDGCTVPNFALSLTALARAMAQFADPRGLVPARRAAAGRVVRAMTAHPELVAGTGRVCTNLMRQSPGLVAKTGAEGVYIAIVPSLGLGVALKIDDGASRAAEIAIGQLLLAHGDLADASRAKVEALLTPTIANAAGLTVGGLAPAPGW